MMDVLKRILAVFLVLTAVAVALNLILTPVYHDGSPEYPVWRILNWFMAAAVLVALVVSYLRRRTLGNGEASTLQYVRASMVYYGAIVLTMLFFWGMVLDVESRQRDRGCHNLAHRLLPDRGRTLRSRRPRHRPPSLERRWRLRGVGSDCRSPAGYGPPTLPGWTGLSNSQLHH